MSVDRARARVAAGDRVSPRGGRSDSVIVLVTILAGWLLYGMTMAPGLLFGDSAEFQFALPIGGLVHPTGYPLYGLLGWLWNAVTVWWPQPATRINAFSVFWAGLSLGVTYLVTQGMLRRVLPRQPAWSRRFCGILATSFVAVSPTFWSQATIAEVYTLHMFLLMVLFYLLLRWAEAYRTARDALALAGENGTPAVTRAAAEAGTRWLNLAALTFGLGLAHHRTMLLVAPAILAFILVVRPTIWRSPPRWGRLLLLAALPLLLYAIVPWQAAQSPYATLTLSPGNTLQLYQPDGAGFVDWIMGVRFAGALRTPAAALAQVPQASVWAGRQFGAGGLVLVLAGLLFLLLRSGRGMAMLSGFSFAALLAFNLFYGIGDIAVLYIPLYFIMGLWLAVGVGVVALGLQTVVDRRRAADRAGQRLPWVVPVLMLAWPLALLLTRYPALDLSQDRTATTWWNAILAQALPGDAILISNDRDEMTPLWYYQYVLHRGQGLLGLFPQIVQDNAYSDIGRVIDSALTLGNGRPVYLVKPMPGLEVKFSLLPQGDLVEVTGSAVTKPAARPTDLTFGDALHLRGYEVDPSRGLQPGDTLTVALYWQPQQKIPGDYTGFVQLLDAGGRKVAQGNDHLAGGHFYPTGLWRPGELLRDTFTMTLPAALPPGPYVLLGGMYRQNIADGSLEPLAPPLEIGKLGILPPQATTSKPPARILDVELGDRVILHGFTLVQGTDDLQVILQWEAERWLDTEYTVFLHLLDGNGEIVGQDDSQPAGGVAPTSIWAPGDPVRDEHRITLGSSLPPGRYQVVCGLYDLDTGARLAITDGPAGQGGDAVVLQEISLGGN